MSPPDRSGMFILESVYSIATEVPMKIIGRRQFAKHLVQASASLAAASALRAHAQTSPPAPPHTSLPASSEAGYRRFSIGETAPFDAPIVFTRNPNTPKLQFFSLRDVTLQSGPLMQARASNRDYMLRLPNDRLLHTFRVNAGLPSTAKPLGGWEDPQCELRGHFVGHYLSACALFYASTGDTVIKAKADGLVLALAQCQSQLGQGGYLSAFPIAFFDRLDRLQKVWAPFYTVHKIMAGLLDMNTQGENDQALDVLLKMADWVDTWTAARTEAHMQEILNTEYGGMNEVLYNLAAVTGDVRWARTGDRFTKKVFFTPLALRRDQLKGQHMNTHVPQVIGAARRYDLSSDYRFNDVAQFFFETVTEARSYATGGSSNNEHWLVDPNRLAAEMHVSSHHQECCCSYNMMKLTRHIYSRSADPRLMDYYERNLLNHRLGAIEPETGHTVYFLSLSPGAWKTTCTEEDTFWCCTGTALEDFSKLNNTIYAHDSESLYVNLYFASTVEWKQQGLRLRQSTDFPQNDRIELKVEKTSAKPWTLQLRIPAWTTAENTVFLNGRRLETRGTPGSYLALSRIWKSGDTVELVLPMRITVEPLADDPTQQAFLYGPLVLAGQFPMIGLADDLDHSQGPDLSKAPSVEVPALRASDANPAAWIKSVPGQPLTFRTTGQAANVTLKPLNQSWQRFAVYWTVS